MSQQTAQTPSFDPSKAEAFLNKALNDTSSATVTVMVAIGDRLGLFKDLAARGPATSAELAQRANMNERYAREWLGAMASAGYLEYNPATRTFTLPPEHAPVLAQENGAHFFGGIYQMLTGMVTPFDRLIQSFRQGGGVPQSAYNDDMWEGMERFTSCWFDNLLLQEWIPAMPDVKSKLEKGSRVADVGCGRGRALIKLAQAFPKSTFVGYDVFGPTISRAAANAVQAGVRNLVRFEQRDVAQGLLEKFDLITTFDVVHDSANPCGLLREIRRALKPDGIYVCLEINSKDKLEENAGPLGAMFYSVSVLYCMTTSLANNGEGLGTAGMPESKVRELCADAGFSVVRRVPLENPFNVLYEVRP